MNKLMNRQKRCNICKTDKSKSVLVKKARNIKKSTVIASEKSFGCWLTMFDESGIKDRNVKIVKKVVESIVSKINYMNAVISNYSQLKIVRDKYYEIEKELMNCDVLLQDLIHSAYVDEDKHMFFSGVAMRACQRKVAYLERFLNPINKEISAIQTVPTQDENLDMNVVECY